MKKWTMRTRSGSVGYQGSVTGARRIANALARATGGPVQVNEVAAPRPRRRKRAAKKSVARKRRAAAPRKSMSKRRSTRRRKTSARRRR